MNRKDKVVKLHDVTINYKQSEFLNLDDENIYLTLRSHPLTLAPAIILHNFLIIVLFGAIITASMFFPISSVTILGLLSVVIFGLFLLGKIILDWYFHMYLITNRKILELSYSPFGDCIINDILLDQVKCTEVDMHSPGFFYQLFDIGNVSITFDRPTHQQEFVMEKIKNYRKVGTLLSSRLTHHEELSEKATEAMWIRDKSDPSQYSYTENLNPTRM